MAGEAIALEGKTLRGSGDGEGPAPHLFSALLHRMRTVIGRRRRRGGHAASGWGYASAGWGYAILAGGALT